MAQRAYESDCSSLGCCRGVGSIPGPARWGKDPVLLQLQLRFNPWPRNFHMPQVWPLK